MRPVYFASAGALRRWFETAPSTATELWVGFRKKGKGPASLSYAEALDEALCVGWIDGIRKSVDDARYTIRFTPRKPRSIWSRVNIGKIDALITAGRVKPSGLAAYRKLSPARQKKYSYEHSPRELAPTYSRRFTLAKTAWTFFSAQPPGYRRTASFWVMSAVKEETQQRRLTRLIADSAAGRRLAMLTPTRSKGKAKK